MNNSVTIIVTVWKRHYLQEQLQSLVNQTVLPKSIWIIQNENHIEIQSVVDAYRSVFPEIYIIHSQFNLKFFGRFSVATLVETEYTFLIDDDVIPSPGWLKTCLEKSKQYNAVISCTGRLIKPFSFRPEAWEGDDRRNYFLGDNQSDDAFNFLAADAQVDYGCNSYFIKTDWIRHFWSIWPATFLSGEDIHLSASLMLTAAIPTIVPRQLTEETSGNVKKFYSQDMLSSWRENTFLDIRQSVFEYLIREKGWKPVLWKNRTL
jgi:GT2 family glycosyltransferase